MEQGLFRASGASNLTLANLAWGGFWGLFGFLVDKSLFSFPYL